MDPRVEIRFKDDTGEWLIYWCGTERLASPGRFDSLELAGVTAREILEREEQLSWRHADANDAKD